MSAVPALAAPTSKIDAHLHTFLAADDDAERTIDDLSTADRAAPIEALQEHFDRCGVTGAVLVPLGPEDSYVAEVVAANPTRYRMIAVAGPNQNDAGELEERLHRIGASGLRVFGLNPQTAPVWGSGVTGQTAEMLTRTQRCLSLYLGLGDIDPALTLAKRYPDLQIVLNHSALQWGTLSVDADGRPRLDVDLSGRAAELQALGSCPNVWIVLSGQYAFSSQPYPYPDLAAYLGELVERVGTERIMWGSDSPWTLTNPGYRDELALPRLQMPQLDADQLDAVMYSNAARLFGFE